MYRSRLTTRRFRARNTTTVRPGVSLAVPACYAGCGLAAGNTSFPMSAFCEADQPRSDREVPGSGWMCPICSVVFGSCSLFDAHMVVVDYSTPAATIRCLPPSEMPGEPLVQDADGTWLTARGAASRQAFTERNRASREAAS